MKNPAAFPTENAHQSGANTYHFEGMTLRDYFAAAAMQAIITANSTNDYDEDPVANNAYKMADAMLKEREK